MRLLGRLTMDRLWVASQILRFAPSGLGAHALARTVLESVDAPPSRRRQRLHGGANVELDLSDRAQAQVYVIRRCEPEVVALISRIAPYGGVFFDVGANIGLITFSVGVRRPDLSIYAFEPDPQNVEPWRRNLELNPRVTAVLEETAVGAGTHAAPLVRGKESGWSFVARRGQPGDVEVPVISLDAYTDAHNITRIDVLKIDVEGYESHVLRGASALLERRAIGIIICELDESLLRRQEATKTSIASFLATFGYVPRPVPGVGAQRIRRRSWETSHDVVFMPVKREHDP